MLFKRSGRFSRKSVFKTLLLSYLAVLVIPVLIGAALYQQIEAIMIENAQNSNAALIEQVKQVVDSRLEEVDQLSQHITSHPKLNNLLAMGPAQTGNERYPLVNFIKDMERYRNINSFINDFYVYLRKSDTILTPVMKTDTSTFYQHIYGYEEFSFDQWKSEVLQDTHNRSFLPSMNVRGDNYRESMVTYMQSLPLGEKDNPLGTLVILINKQQIDELLAQVNKANHGIIYIKDEQSRIIMSTADHEGEALEQVDDSGLVTVSTFSDRNQWEYVSVVPDHVFWEKVNIVKTAALAMLTFCLFAGAIACYFMTYRAYRPLKELKSFIHHVIRQGSKATEDQVEHNEYDYIRNSMSYTLAKQQQMQGMLTRQTPVIRSNFLGRLLKGYVEDRQLQPSALSFMGIHTPHSKFAVILIKVDDCSGFIRDDSESEWALIRFIISKVSEEMPSYHSYPVELERDRIAVILNIPEQIDEAEHYEWMVQFRHIIEHRFKTTVTLAVSDIHQGIGKVPICYQECSKAMDYSMFKAYHSILLYKEIMSAEHTYYDFPLESEAQLINATKSGDFDKARQIIHNLYISNFEGKQVTPGFGRLLFSNLLSTLFKLLNALNIKYEGIFGEKRDPFGRMDEGSSMQELYDDVLSMYEQVCSHVKEQACDTSTKMLGQIKRYIEANYADPMLSLASIAEEFRLTAPYMSSFFKKHSGVNITDYIAQVRISQSKELMTTKDATISHIARAVGYANDVGFIRMFKKYEGITPGKYKEMLLS